MISSDMNLPTVNNLEEHEFALVRLETLMLLDPPEGSLEEQEIVALAAAIEAFEKRVFVI